MIRQEDAAHRLLSLEELCALSASERCAYFLARAYMATEHLAAISEALQAIGWFCWSLLREKEREIRKEEASL